MSPLQQRTIGDRQVSAIGLGGMPLSIENRPDEEQAIATIHAALDAGVTLIDTANSYHLLAGEVGHNERLIAKALKTWEGGDPATILVATKGGHLRPGDGSWTVDGHPDYLKRAAAQSLKDLGVEQIELYQFHRPDSTVPYEESLGAIRELLDDGVIRQAGISNANPEQIRLAQEVLGGRLVSVQNQFSPLFRSSLPELQLCDELGIAFLAYAPLGSDGRAKQIGALAPAFGEVAKVHGVSPQVAALAWELAQSAHVIPIPGAKRAASILDSITALDVRLSADELALLNSGN